MSRTSVWISIVCWAVSALLTAWLSVRLLASAYADMHPGLQMVVWIFAIQAVYGIRGFARRRGWVMASYAPGRD